MLELGLTKIIPYIVYFSAILVIFIALRKPKIGLYFLIPLLPFTDMFAKLDNFPFGRDMMDLLYLSTIFGWFFHIRDEKGKIFTENQINKYAILLIIFSFISLFIGASYWGLGNPLDYSDIRLRDWKNFVMLPLLFLMTINVIKNKKETVILVLLMILALLLADINFYQNMRYKDLSFYRKDVRTGGIFYYLGPNELAAFYTHFLFLPLGLMIYERKKIIKIFYAGVASFTLYPILFLFSRGAYIGLLIGLLYMGVRKSKLIILVLIILAFLWTSILPKAVIERVEMTESETGELDHSSTLRLDYWSIGIKQFMRNPLTGVGFNTSHYFRGGDLHNAYITLLAEQGIIGLWIFLAFLYITFRSSVWLESNANDNFFKGLGLSTGSTVIALSVTNLFGNRWTYLQLSAFFVVLMALVINAKISVGKGYQIENS